MLEGTPDEIFQKKILNLNISIYISVDAVFNGDYESAIIFMKICSIRMKIVKYGPILAYSARHFNNSITNDCYTVH